jgi:serine/threonine protein phosphatase 1
MAGRTLAIGDIHGCLHALRALIEAVELGPEDTLVTLGDHIDRGPETFGVVELLIKLAGQCKLVPLMGDHEELLQDALGDKANVPKWLRCGGGQTLRSYGWTPVGPKRSLADWIPRSHQEFLARCRPYHETNSHIFVHAGFIPDLPMETQPGLALRWRVTDARSAVPHNSGKIAVVGHTAQLTGEVLDLGFLVCIDTNCARGGWLTAIDIDSRRIWQVDSRGTLRVPDLPSGL